MENKKYLKKIGIISLFSTNIVVPALGKIDSKIKVQKYENELKDYNNKITDYAKEVKDLKLNDIQIFMKVMDDMWNSIRGYGETEINILGFLELDLATEEGQGVCRNMASDIARKLNKINPEYNARTLVVDLFDDNIKLANIDRKILSINNTVVDENKKEKNTNEEDDESKIKKNFGNHMVTLVDINDENLVLVLDPTNPAIGIYVDGQIKMFNGGKYRPKEYANYLLNNNGYKNMFEESYDEISSYIKSFKNPELSYDELEEKYGLSAQNEALEHVRSLKIKENKEFYDIIKINLDNNVTVSVEDKKSNIEYKKDNISEER